MATVDKQVKFDNTSSDKSTDKPVDKPEVRDKNDFSDVIISDHFLSYTVRSSLIDLLDTIILVQTSDNKRYIGKLGSFDQYSNLILKDTIERIIIDNNYCDIKIGLMVLRGDNIVLIGQIEKEKFKKQQLKLNKVDEKEIKLLKEKSNNSNKKINIMEIEN